MRSFGASRCGRAVHVRSYVSIHPRETTQARSFVYRGGCGGRATQTVGAEAPTCHSRPTLNEHASSSSVERISRHRRSPGEAAPDGGARMTRHRPRRPGSSGPLLGKRSPRRGKSGRRPPYPWRRQKSVSWLAIMLAACGGTVGIDSLRTHEAHRI